MNLCLAVDRIDDDLRRLVEFLNRITSHDVAVAALQLQHARHGAVEIIVPTTFGAEMASSKARRGLERERWTKESFLAALTDDNDRLTVAELFKRVEATATEMMGHHTLFSFGLVPAGGVMLYPYGVQFSPAQLSVTGGDTATVFGHWSWYSKVAGNDGFAPLAQLLGQDHRGSAAQVPLREIDLETLWVVITGTAQALSMTRADGTGVRDPS